MSGPAYLQVFRLVRNLPDFELLVAFIAGKQEGTAHAWQPGHYSGSLPWMRIHGQPLALNQRVVPHKYLQRNGSASRDASPWNDAAYNVAPKILYTTMLVGALCQGWIFACSLPKSLQK
jgi:hypothetical protein